MNHCLAFLSGMVLFLSTDLYLTYYQLMNENYFTNLKILKKLVYFDCEKIGILLGTIFIFNYMFANPGF